jgi:hypothetical protein
LCAIIFALIIFTPQNLYALGLSPGLYKIDKVLNNVSLKKRIIISRNNPAKEDKFVVSVVGDAAQYIKLSTTDFILPKGQKEVGYDFIIEPKNLQNGKYNATIYFEPEIIKQTATDTKSSGNSILYGGQVSIYFTVTDEQVIGGLVSNVKFNDIELGEGQRLPFSFNFKNLSNVDTAPNKIQITVKNSEDVTVIDNKLEEIKIVELVRPEETGMLVSDIPVNLPLGTYSANIGLSINDTAVGSAEKMIFKVLPIGSLTQTISYEQLSIRPKELEKTGDIAYFEATARNTGKLAYQAVLHVEILDGEKVIDIIESDKVLMIPNQKALLKLSKPINNSGTFKVRSFIDFGPNRSEEKNGEIKVGGFAYGIWAIIVLILTFISGGVFILFKHSRRSSTEKEKIDEKNSEEIK